MYIINASILPSGYCIVFVLIIVMWQARCFTNLLFHVSHLGKSRAHWGDGEIGRSPDEPKWANHMYSLAVEHVVLACGQRCLPLRSSFLFLSQLNSPVERPPVSVPLVSQVIFSLAKTALDVQVSTRIRTSNPSDPAALQGSNQGRSTIKCQRCVGVKTQILAPAMFVLLIHHWAEATPWQVCQKTRWGVYHGIVSCTAFCWSFPKLWHGSVRVSQIGQWCLHAQTQKGS